MCRRLLALILPFILIGTATFADGECVNRLLPQAIHIEKVKTDSFTAYADRFMQVMEGPYLNHQDKALIQSPFFTEFIKRFLPELKSNHLRNRAYAKEDFTGRDSRLLERNFKNLDQYISRLEGRISNGSHLSYQDMMSFSYILLTTREPEADRRLIALYNTNSEQLVHQRYPGKELADLKNMATKRGSYEYQSKFWLQLYGKSLPKQDGSQEHTIFQLFDSQRALDFSARNKIMPLPSPYAAGPIAFYLNYHLPINPLALPSEFELLDNVNLASPLANFLHDIGHYQNLNLRVEMNNFFHDLELNQSMKIDLEKIKLAVEDKNDPILLKVLYFLIYYIRFESTQEFPISIERLQRRLEILISPYGTYFDKREDSDIGGETLYRLFDQSLLSPFAPATNRTEFTQKFAEIIYIISEFNLRNAGLPISQFLLKRVSLFHHYLENRRLNSPRQRLMNLNQRLHEESR